MCILKVVIRVKYNCAICGNYFEKTKSELICPICGNSDENYLLKAIEIEEDKKDDIQERIKHFLSRKCHSAAYIKLCSKRMEELGQFDLAKELDIVAQKKLEYEAILLDMLGIKNDIRLNLNNVLTRAMEDVHIAEEIMKLEEKEDNESIIHLLKQMKADEEKNVFILNNIAKKCLTELKEIR